jgi:predicted transposase YbfD/YdcC
MKKKHIATVIRELKRIPDPRQAWKIRYSLYEILLIAIIAVIANANSSYEIHVFAQCHHQWLKQFLPLKNGIPSRLTIDRVLRLVNPKHFNAVFIQIMKHIQSATQGAVVALDGKAYHTTRENNGDMQVLYMVNAWCSANGMTLGQVETNGKGNEITTIPKVLHLLNLTGAIVTIDAIGCQRTIVEQIVKQNKADYAIALKENQPTMYHEFKLYAQDCLTNPNHAGQFQYYKKTEKGHGRIETREYYLFHNLSWFQDRKDWTKLNGFIMVRSTRKRKGHAPSVETRYYITSLTQVEQAAYAVRSHWGIENSLHWVLDVVFKEDDWKTKDMNSASNLAVIRRITTNLLKAHPSKETTPIKRYLCSLDINFLESVLFNSSFFS